MHISEMASRYLFKVEYGENRFCSFFVNLTDFSDYSFVKLTNDKNKMSVLYKSLHRIQLEFVFAMKMEIM
jgi:hypothetical protein